MNQVLNCSSLLAIAFCFVWHSPVFGQDQATTSRLQGSCFGLISWEVTVGGTLSESQEEQLQDAVQQRLDQINARMSTYRDDSDVSRFNASTSTDWFAVEAETALVVQRSLEISAATQGAFDVTVGPLIGLYHFGAAANQQDATPTLPSAEEIAQTLSAVGYDKLQVQLSPPTLRKSVASLQIDLSAIAKGYAVDQVAKVVTEAGFQNYFVMVGEEVAASGKHPAGRQWVCGIEKPVEQARHVLDIRVPLVDSAIATSGDYRQYYVIDGKRISHTVDPRSGKPATSAVALASVKADDCMTADAFATAMMVLPITESEQIAAQLGLGIHLVQRGENGEFVTVENSQYPAALPPTQAVESVSWLLPVGISILIFGIAVVSMSVGVLFKREPIKGSCGGLANMPGATGSACDLCSNPSKECQEMGRGARKAMAEQAES